MSLVDSHAHLDHLEDVGGALARAKKAGVTKIVTIGTTIAESENACNLALSCSRLQPERRSARGPGLDIRTTGLDVYATAGIHPKDGRNDIKKFGIDESIHRLKTITQSSKKVVAIGECGLDYYEQETRNNKQKTGEAEKKLQRELFKAQIKLAANLNLPLVIHCRNGWDEIFDILKTSIKYSSSRRRDVSSKADSRHPRESEDQILNPFDKTQNKRVQDDKGKFSLRSNNMLPGVFHSWTGDWGAAQKALNLGFYISFSGIVSFKNASAVQDTARRMPLDRMLIETDSPFLAPEPLRSAPFEESQDGQGKLGQGKKNEPENVKIIARFIADIRKLTLDEVAAQTSFNAQELFKLL